MQNRVFRSIGRFFAGTGEEAADRTEYSILHGAHRLSVQRP